MPGVVSAMDCCAIVSAQVLAQIDAAVLAEARDRFAGCGIERVQKIHDAGKEAALLYRRSTRKGRGSGCVPVTPESKFQSSLPVAASSAMTFCVGVYA